MPCHNFWKLKTCKILPSSRPREREALLWGWIVDEFNALLNVALQTILAGLKELLLIRADVAKDVGSLLGTRGLEIRQSHVTGYNFKGRKHTPSSTGTEK